MGCQPGNPLVGLENRQICALCDKITALLGKVSLFATPLRLPAAADLLGLIGPDVPLLVAAEID